MAHEAFAAAADPVLERAPAPVAHLGIDEHRRGRPRWRLDADTGEYLLLADRWHTCFFDLSGDQGLLGQVEGRTADDAAYWLAQATPAWRDAVRVVAIDMCSIYASAVRRMLPGAQIAVDLFHVVHLAVKMTGDVRRRVVRGKYGRRGRSGDPEYGIKNLLVRNLEHLSPAQFAKVIDTLQRGPGRAGDRRRLDRQGETPRRAEPARPRHRLCPVRAPRPRPALRLLRLVRPQRRHPRAGQPGPDDLPVGRPDHLRGPDRRHERSGFTLHPMLMIRCLVWRSGVLCLAELMVAWGSDSFRGRGGGRRGRCGSVRAGGLLAGVVEVPAGAVGAEGADEAELVPFVDGGAADAVLGGELPAGNGVAGAWWAARGGDLVAGRAGLAGLVEVEAVVVGRGGSEQAQLGPAQGGAGGDAERWPRVAGW